MELKDYQQQALDTLDRYVEALKEARQQADKATAYLASNGIPDFLIEQAANLAKQAEDYPHIAWENLRKTSVLPGVPNAQGQDTIPEHISRESAAGEPIPLIGRVMRQPYARATNLTELDSCYIVCYNQE